MANVADKVIKIRQAVYGRDVREYIASGIEAINTEVENTTSRQDAIDANEDQRKRNETDRINNENNRQKAEDTRNKKEKDREDKFILNENNRQNVFNSREQEREEWYTEFRKWYNEQAIKGRLPVNLDGGYFGEDDSSDKVYDCCNFGD